jgi:hypothetical protein
MVMGVWILIGDYDLARYVPLPMMGVWPVRALGRPGMTVTAEWERGDGREWAPFREGLFQFEEQYRATISLTARGHGFKKGMEFGYAGGVEGQEQDGGNDGYRRVVRVTYKPFLARVTAERFGDEERTGGSAAGAIGANAGEAGVNIALPGEGEMLGAGEVVLVKGLSPPVVIIEGVPGATELTLGVPRSFMTVGAGVTVTLRNLTLRGMGENAFPLMTVERQGTVILENVTISGNRLDPRVRAPAAGIQVRGTLIMRSGTRITDNQGDGADGVYVEPGGIFELYGGSISNHRNSGVCMGGGIFNMYEDIYGGSQISGNNTGVNIHEGVFNMYGGSIEGNTEYGVFLGGGGSFTMCGNAQIPPAANYGNAIQYN